MWERSCEEGLLNIPDLLFGCDVNTENLVCCLLSFLVRFLCKNELPELRKTVILLLLVSTGQDFYGQTILPSRSAWVSFLTTKPAL